MQMKTHTLSKHRKKFTTSNIDHVKFDDLVVLEKMFSLATIQHNIDFLFKPNKKIQLRSKFSIYKKLFTKLCSLQKVFFQLKQSLFGWKTKRNKRDSSTMSDES